MSYQDEKTRLEELGEAHEVATKAAREVKAFFARHPEILDCLANYDIIYKYFPQALEDIDAASLEDSYLNHPRFAASLARHASEAGQRDMLENRILELSRGGTSPEGLRGIQAAFRFQNLEQLRAKRDSLEESARLRAKTLQELRSEIQAAIPSPATELPADISREQILRMWEPEMFRFWAKKVGMNAITKRINEGRQ